MDDASLATYSPVFAAWIKANNDHNLAGILGCYGTHVTMFATFEDFLSSSSQRRCYFINFLANPGMRAEVNSVRLEKDGDAVILWGEYTFSHQKGGVENVVPARFTMVIEQGKITHHHSSQLAGTCLVESEYQIQEWETIADRTISGGLNIKAGFCHLTPRNSKTEGTTFALDGLLFGRYTLISRDGNVIHKHVSPDPSSLLSERLEKHLQNLRQAS